LPSEGKTAVGKWRGVRFSEFLKLGADTSAKYVTLRAPTIMPHRSTCRPPFIPKPNLRFWFDDELLPRQYGFPIKLRISTKLGFKNPKHLRDIEVGNDFTAAYWETHGYNWFSGL